MIRKYKNIAAFSIISFFLLVPFVVIKTLGADYEIFPAAIFPGGADRKHIGDEIVLRSMDLYGKRADKDEFVELNKRFLLKKIYIHHMVYFITPEFIGAIPYDEKQDIANNPYAAYATDADIAQTKRWLRNGLLEQNCRDSVVMVKFTELKIDKITRKLISDTVVDEKVFNLY